MRERERKGEKKTVPRLLVSQAPKKEGQEERLFSTLGLGIGVRETGRGKYFFLMRNCFQRGGASREESPPAAAAAAAAAAAHPISFSALLKLFTVFFPIRLLSVHLLAGMGGEGRGKGGKEVES